MKKEKSYKVVVFRKSCLTGQAVWLCQGWKSLKAEREAYYRACQREVKRVRRWGVTVKRRMANIRRLLCDCTAGIPLTAKLTAEQRTAARELEMQSRTSVACYRGFYDHILEERRRRGEDKRLRQAQTCGKKTSEKAD